MSQIADQNKPEHLEVAPSTPSRRAFSALTKVTLAALLGNALAYTVYQKCGVSAPGFRHGGETPPAAAACMLDTSNQMQ